MDPKEFRLCQNCTRPTCCEDAAGGPLCWWCYRYELLLETRVVIA